MRQVLIYGGMVGINSGIVLSVNWGRATDLIPAEEGGRYLAVSNLATAGSGVLAAAGGFLLVRINAQPHNLGSPAPFLSAATCYVVGTLFAAIVKVTHKKRPSRSLTP